ncbi:MAG: right-handed parallel beta-helix repeat-containing protein [Thermoplasmata archaeon]|nr:right-handed parallel beta-helix repeat-containing protein [Thermoplasmata archaeon]
MRAPGGAVVALTLLLLVVYCPLGFSSGVAQPPGTLTGAPSTDFSLPPLHTPSNPPAALTLPPPPPRALSSPDVTGSVTVIRPDGTISNVSAPLAVAGLNYTITGPFYGAILDERNGSVLNGAGYVLQVGANLSSAIEVYDTNGVSIENFVIVNASVGVLVEGAQGINITGNTIASTGYAIDLQYASGAVVQGNNGSHDYGDLFQVVAGLLVQDNTFASSAYAIYAEDVNGARFIDNDCNGSTQGISVYNSAVVTVWGNNLSHAQYGLIEQGVSGAIISWSNASLTQYPIDLYLGGEVSGTDNAGIEATIGLTVFFTVNASLANESFPEAVEYGAELEDAVNVSLTGSDFAYAGYQGVFVGDTTNAQLAGDDVDHFVQAGIVVSQSTGVQIIGSTARFGAGSLAPAFSTFSDQRLSLVGSDGSYSPYGVEDQGSLDLNVTDCTFLDMTGGGAGISLQNDVSVLVNDDRIVGSTGNALDAFGSTDLTVTNSSFRQAAQEAIHVQGSSGVTITGNDASLAGFTGLDLEQLDGFSVGGNNASLTTTASGIGLYLASDSSGTVLDNAATGQQTAVELVNATNVVVQGNNGSRSTYGLYLDQDVNCTLRGNTLWQDTYGFLVASSARLAIYHNNFIDDAGWALPSSTLQANWSDGYPGGGNYWSNHTSPDSLRGPGQNQSGSDGIVDSPVILNSTNRDPYPLAQAWVVHTVTFTETGLPVGRAWSVLVNGSQVGSSTPSVVYDQPNAVSTTYVFTIVSPGGFIATPPVGTVSPGAGNATVSIAFAPFLYNLTFEGSGLAATANWSVTAGPLTASGAGGDPLTFPLPNGTVDFRVGNVTDYAATPRIGTAEISGGDQSITIAFTLVTFSIMFIEEGLPSGANWSVTLNGAEKAGSGTALTFLEPNGTDTFSVEGPPGYVAHPGESEEPINGTASIFVEFSPPATDPIDTPIGLALLGLVIGLMVVSLLTGYLLLRARRSPPNAGTSERGAGGPRGSGGRGGEIVGGPERAPPWRQPPA